ncbi:DNA polymerase III subunit gamma/tau [Rubellimicrobium roseum]|uniref:DNA polymerase III subunit gamma/tau n=1 Tax=Rubellimicrobium roseum TaxID=687525 RepID=A0A5C4NIE0_9RHOB|nr:DNA polymerase III subunit gamma/tau [Rubellimicrobium roseum]TNC74363.1 DNA polymerase III subunit gamma/tau [Rubellimicrobium roseum]
MPLDASTSYRVLARKYRPETFADLVGQEAMVRTLRNAFKAGRIAQAFILTGIRGTGKTTTARIIAKGLNCIGPDGQGSPTTEPCGVCVHCRAISEGRHVDVLEMDAASRTGVGDIREIIDSVRYRAAEARYKVYIIDEVHMLSTNAFNALLKTLEEPPEHVKFIFATTEIRKVPVTVLSRCQRFDLRRIEPEVMMGLLRRIATAEGAGIEDGALALIARAAEGSARDATSLLDQAIAGGGPATAEQVRAMLGLADRGRVLDLFDFILKGEAAAALEELGAQYADGADPVMVLRDLAEIAHWISVLKVSPTAADDPTLSPDERARGQAMASAIPMRVLARFWQMLLKALEEVAVAPNAMMAVEMAIIRLTHVADLPSPEELVRQLQGARGAPAMGQGVPGPAPRAPVPQASRAVHGLARAGGLAAMPAGHPHPLDRFARFEDVVQLVRDQRDIGLLMEVETGVRLARYQPGRIEFEPASMAAPDLAQRLGQKLQQWTGTRWGVSVVSEGGQPSIREAQAAHANALEAEAMAHPFVQAALKAFPGARLRVQSREEKLQAAEAEALPEVPDEWDPFEE